MSVIAGLGRLKQSGKDLRVAWQAVQAAWQDENCRHFQESHMEPLLARLRAVEQAMAHMASILQQARHDCE
jgi:hypothetical protein